MSECICVYVGVSVFFCISMCMSVYEWCISVRM